MTLGRNPELDSVLGDAYTVARHLLRGLVEDALESDIWGLCPEIGEGDFELVLNQLGRLVLPVPQDIYQAAYDRLAARAAASAGRWEDEGQARDTKPVINIASNLL